jgi:hypothetical protein
LTENKTEDKKLTELEWHRKMAAQLFNQTWDLIDKGENRTQTESDDMIHSAHASRYHWGVVVASDKYPKSGPMNLERGDWQISRVYALLEKQEPALYYAQRCLSICEEHKIGDFDFAFALEAMARAYAITGDAKSNEYLQKAKKAGQAISKEDDKKYFLSELDTIN